MTIAIIECEEFGGIEIGVNSLIVDGGIKLDPRIVDRGYLNVSLVKGQVTFRADRYIGLIPVNEKLSIRIRPRALIGNLAHMIVKSGVAPAVIADFSRGYMPKFEPGAELERIYCAPLIGGVERILELGMMKSYEKVENPPAWRGRFLLSDSIKRHRARNVRYRGEFDYRALVYGGIENIALKHSLKMVQRWLVAQNDKKLSGMIARGSAAVERMSAIPELSSLEINHAVREIGRSASLLPSQYHYYRNPLWTAYLLLQKLLPNVSADGFVTLDSLIVDVSMVFECYVRTVLAERAHARGWRIVDGNLKPFPFFTNDASYKVKPDMVIILAGTPVALIDAKYKPEPKESDRYQLLSFMDAVGVRQGAFVCPQLPRSASRFMGMTGGGKRLSLLRFDLSAADMEREADRFADNVAKLTISNYDYS